MLNIYKKNVPCVYEKCTTCIEKSRHVLRNRKKFKEKPMKTLNANTNYKKKYTHKSF